MFLVNFLEPINIVRCFLHSFSFSFSHKQILILSNIDLLILPISFWAGFIGLNMGWLTKFSLWSSGYKAITCFVYFYSAKCIRSFCVLYVFMSAENIWKFERLLWAAFKKIRYNEKLNYTEENKETNPKYRKSNIFGSIPLTANQLKLILVNCPFA